MSYPSFSEHIAAISRAYFSGPQNETGEICFTDALDGIPGPPECGSVPYSQGYRRRIDHPLIPLMEQVRAIGASPDNVDFLTEAQQVAVTLSLCGPPASLLPLERHRGDYPHAEAKGGFSGPLVHAKSHP